MTLTLGHVAVDCRDAGKIARFWAELLDYEVSYDSRDDPEGDPADPEIELSPKNGSATKLLFLEVPEGKTVKNRLHFDLLPDDQEAEVARAEGLGARRIDIGQGQQTWVVMADPEGNEFCILRAKSPDDE